METTQEQLFDGKTLEEKVQSLSPMFAVVCVNPDGTLSGLVENSFAMSKSADRVNVFWSGRGYSMLGEHNLDGKSWAKQNCNPARGWFMVELGTENCPIEIDLVNWFQATSKYNKRNALFKMREGFDFSEEAKAAAVREAYDEKHKSIMELVEVRNRAEEVYNQKMREAKRVLDASTVKVNDGFKKLRNKYQSKAKSIAIERGKCPKLPDGRYMNTGNCRITEHGIQLKWFSAGPVVYTVAWKDLF